MQDNRPEIVLDGDISPFRQKLRQAGEDLKRFGSEGESAIGRMTGPLGTLQKSFVAIGAVLAGGKVFSAAVEESRKLVGEANALARSMGIGATEASALNIALGDVYSSADEFIGASQQLGRQLRTNEDDLKAMGLVTRDANGEFRNLKDLMFDSIEVLRGYKEGTDRNLAAQVLFGRGAGDVTTLLRLQRDGMEDARKKAEELGLAVGKQNVEAMKEYKAAMNDAGDVTSALGHAIGSAVTPALTEMAKGFADAGPQLVKFARLVMETLAGIVDLAKIVVNSFVSVGKDIGAVAAAATMAFKGDLAGAADVFRDRAVEAQKELAHLKDLWNGTGDSLLGKVRSQYKSDDLREKPSGDKSFVAPPDKDKKKKAKEETMLPKWEAELAALKDAFEQENVLRQYSKQQELEFWRSKLAMAESGSKDYLALAKKVSTLSLEIRRQEAKDALDLEQAKDDGRRRSALFAIEQEEQAARFARENNAITKLDLLKLEEDFLRRRFEIEQAAQQERLALIENDPTQSPAALERARQAMLEIEERYKLQKGDNKHRQDKEDGSLGGMFDSIGVSFGQAVDGMLTKAKNLRQTMQQIFVGIRDAFLQNVVVKPFTEWLAMQMKKLALFLGFSRTEQASTQTTAVQAMATVANQTSAEVGSKGASAAAGAAESVASIPYVGPILAAAAFAATLAMVLGARSNIRSAAGGYDIPKGLNPMVQAHEEEMILPAKYANMFRAMEEQGGVAGGGSGAVHMHVHTQSTKDFERFLKANSHALAPGLRNLARNFTSVKKS